MYVLKVSKFLDIIIIQFSVKAAKVLCYWDKGGDVYIYRGRGQGSIREMDKQLTWSDKWPMCWASWECGPLFGPLNQ